MTEILHPESRLEHAKYCLEQIALRTRDVQTKHQLEGVARALGVAESRLEVLEAVVRRLALNAELGCSDLDHPTGRQLPEDFVAELLRR